MIIKLKIFLKKIINFLSREVQNYSITNKIITKSQIDYLLSIHKIFLEVKDVPGDIIELGVGRGRNAIIFVPINKYEYGNLKHYGFDTFDQLPERELK